MFQLTKLLIHNALHSFVEQSLNKNDRQSSQESYVTRERQRVSSLPCIKTCIVLEIGRKCSSLLWKPARQWGEGGGLTKPKEPTLSSGKLKCQDAIWVTILLNFNSIFWLFAVWLLLYYMNNAFWEVWVDDRFTMWSMGGVGMFSLYIR